MRHRLIAKLLPLTLLLLLVLAPAADAYNDGRGFAGGTSDFTVTMVGFGMVVFFPTFVFTMSMIQKRLDKRKDARKAAKKLLGGAEWHGGW